MKLCYDLRAGVAVRHVKVKPRCAVLTMLKRLDKIRFRGPRTREDFPDLAESPPASDNECSDEVQLKPRPSLRETEEILRDPAGSGSPTMAAAIQDFQRSESDRLNEVKGHLEIALLEKHFLPPFRPNGDCSRKPLFDERLLLKSAVAEMKISPHHPTLAY
ncbi:GRAM domain-containing protein 4-like [Notothenia coriiceps]|uniref:GRAM domain-containing protein 4-like n=1 Tax=Notothenia coriiceps TaxID=8208 RepID=A0A6I9PFF1_9TELE|nr:PREDICTED: GRAM domain-containing protein 4-like [Notothenia coriiceps]